MHLLPSLELLHIRIPPVVLLSANVNASAQALGQVIATRLFQFVDSHAICPRFLYIVWGCERKAFPLTAMDEETFQRSRVHQQCFVRRRTVMDGQEMVLAEKVSRARLHDMAPELDILDHDPLPRLLGGMPASFHGLRPGAEDFANTA
jgi:hypothetical protein